MLVSWKARTAMGFSASGTSGGGLGNAWEAPAHILRTDALAFAAVWRNLDQEIRLSKNHCVS